MESRRKNRWTKNTLLPKIFLSLQIYFSFFFWVKISNESVRESLNVESAEGATRNSRWTGHVIRMNDNHLPKRMFCSKVVGQRSRDRPRRRFLDSVKSDLNERGYEWRRETLWLARNRVTWRGIVRGDRGWFDQKRPHAARQQTVYKVWWWRMNDDDDLLLGNKFNQLDMAYTAWLCVCQWNHQTTLRWTAYISVICCKIFRHLMPV